MTHVPPPKQPELGLKVWKFENQDSVMKTVRIIGPDAAMSAWIAELTTRLSTLSELVPRPVEIIDLVRSFPRASRCEAAIIPRTAAFPRPAILQIPVRPVQA